MIFNEARVCKSLETGAEPSGRKYYSSHNIQVISTEQQINSQDKHLRMVRRIQAISYIQDYKRERRGCRNVYIKPNQVI